MKAEERAVVIKWAPSELSPRAPITFETLIFLQISSCGLS
jgi:hypothetical protein